MSQFKADNTLLIATSSSDQHRLVYQFKFEIFRLGKQEVAPVASNKAPLNCGGRSCTRCGKCDDWHCNP